MKSSRHHHLVQESVSQFRDAQRRYARWPLSARLACQTVLTVAASWFIWLLIVGPALDRLALQKRAYAAARAQYEWLQQQAPGLSVATQSVAVSNEAAGTLVSVITRSAQAHGIPVSQYTPDEEDQRLRLTVDNVAFEPLMTWLHELVSPSLGLRIVNARVSQASVPGQVSANIDVRRQDPRPVK